MPEVPLDFPRAWVEFPDPADDEQAFRCDLTWLTSSWSCIFGNGCQGIYADQPDGRRLLHPRRALLRQGRREAGQGLRQAAHPGDVAALRPEELDREGRGGRAQDPGRRRRLHLRQPARLRRRRGLRPARPRAAHRAGTSSRPSRTSAGSCRSGGPTTGSTRPDGTEVLVVVIAEYDRRGWGPGGHDLDWYCSGNTEAHVGAEPVYVSMRAELVELMGQKGYDELVTHCRGPPRFAAPVRPAPGRPEEATAQALTGSDVPERRRRAAGCIPASSWSGVTDRGPRPVLRPSRSPRARVVARLGGRLVDGRRAARAARRPRRRTSTPSPCCPTCTSCCRAGSRSASATTPATRRCGTPTRSRWRPPRHRRGRGGHRRLRDPDRRAGLHDGLPVRFGALPRNGDRRRLAAARAAASGTASTGCPRCSC